MSPNDIEYYRQRAATERALAQAADRRTVAEIHEELARLYEALIVQPEPRPAVQVAEPAGLRAYCSEKCLISP